MQVWRFGRFDMEKLNVSGQKNLIGAECPESSFDARPTIQCADLKLNGVFRKRRTISYLTSSVLFFLMIFISNFLISIRRYTKNAGRDLKEKGFLSGLGRGKKLLAAHEDGYSWRKYGKNYPHGSAAYPTHYYRCKQRGCKATKKMTLKDPTVFEVTYGQKHGCVEAEASNSASTAESLENEKLKVKERNLLQKSEQNQELEQGNVGSTEAQNLGSQILWVAEDYDYDFVDRITSPTTMSYPPIGSDFFTDHRQL